MRNPHREDGAPRVIFRGRRFEVALVLVTGAGFLVFSLSFIYIATASLFWLVYVLARHRWDHDVFVRWGFRREGFLPALRLSLPYLGVAVAACVLFGILSSRALVNLHLPLLLLIYPAWGVVQQFLIVALIGENMIALSGGRIRERQAVVITALLFAALHIPELLLVPATFLLGLLTTSVYFRTKNLWVPGIVHGWFASVYYFMVMGEDPWAELVSAAFWM